MTATVEVTARHARCMTSPARASPPSASAAASPGRSWSSRDPRHPVPVLLDAAHRAVQQHAALRRHRQPAAGQTSRWAASSGCWACQTGRGGASPQAAPGGRSTSGCYLRNSVIVATLITVGQVFFCAMAAYAFARLRWPRPRQGLRPLPGRADGSGDLHAAAELRADQATSGCSTPCPGIVLPTLLMTPFAIFFLRQFFLGITREIEEAAHDRRRRPRSGSSSRLILPMSAAPIATLAILTYIGAWNEYFWPLMVSLHRHRRAC